MSCRSPFGLVNERRVSRGRVLRDRIDGTIFENASAS
jgi:hypothetical protein